MPTREKTGPGHAGKEEEEKIENASDSQRK